MQAIVEGGVREFVVVTGYNGPRVRAFLDSFARTTATHLTHVVNEEWEKPNGYSVLKAREVLTEPFLLTMSDHLFDPTIVTDLIAQPLAGGETILAVDYKITNPLVDLDDVTRVQVVDGYIHSIGKGLEMYNAFDTGIFYCTPALFEAIERSIATEGNGSLSGGMRRLARARKARPFDIGDRFWLDIDEPEEADTAEQLLREEVVRQLRFSSSSNTR